MQPQVVSKPGQKGHAPDAAIAHAPQPPRRAPILDADVRRDEREEVGRADEAKAEREHSPTQFGRDLAAVSVTAAPAAALLAAPIAAPLPSPKRIPQRKNADDDRSAFAEDWLPSLPSTPALAQLSTAPTPAVVQRACSSSASCACDKCRTSATQRKAATFASSIPATEIRALAGAGLRGAATTLPYLDAIQRSFGHHDVTGIKAHLGTRATEASRGMQAKAYAAGESIAFAGTPTLHTVAHEAAHIVQQSGGIRPDRGVGAPGDPFERHADEVADRVVRGESAEALLDLYAGPDSGAGGVNAVQRQSEDEADEEEQTPAPPTETPDNTAPVSVDPGPPQFSLSVSVGGLMFRPAGNAILRPGSRERQALQVVLRRLLGSQYQPGMEVQVRNILVRSPGGFKGTAKVTGEATAPEQWEEFLVTPSVALGIVGWAQAAERRFRVNLTDEQLDLLALGVGARRAWEFIQRFRDHLVTLPAWFTKPENESTFINQMSSRTDLLRKVMVPMEQIINTPGDRVAAEAVLRGLNDLLSDFQLPLSVLDTIREDAALVAHPAYQALFPLRAARGDNKAPKKRTQKAGSNESPDREVADHFLTWIAPQVALAEKAENDHDTRRELLDRFFSFLNAITVAQEATGDQKTRARPERVQAVLPRFDARLTGAPPIEAPLFAAVPADYAFDMQLMFTDVGEAFAKVDYQWERVELDVESGKEGKSTEPTSEEARKAGYAKTARDNAEDIRNFGGSIINVVGPPGVDLVEVNNALRYAGTVLRYPIQALTEPESVRHVVFPHPGWFLVRVTAVPRMAGDGDVVRAPSVAYTPVHVSEPEALAEQITQLQVGARERKIKRMLELEQMLSQPTELPNQPELQKEYDALVKELVLSTTLDQLNSQRAALVSRLGELPIGSFERQQVKNQIDTVDGLLRVRGRRAGAHRLSTATRVTATFVGDGGQILPLTLEAVRETPAGATRETYYVSDLTTPKSDDATAEGNTAAEAITNAVVKILQGTHGYGRGHVSIHLTGNPPPIRIGISAGNLINEAIGNITTAIAAVAIVAAPGLGEAAMGILLPVGLIGAIPSVYRIATTVENGTFVWDIDTVIDIVNIVGGFTGVGVQAASALRQVRLARGLMIIGVGADRLGVLLMGAKVVSDIDSIDPTLSPGLRRARVMEIVAQAGLQAGMMFANELSQRAQAERARTSTPEQPGPAPKPSPDVEPGGAPRPGPDVEPGGAPGAPRQRPPSPALSDPAFQSWERSLQPETRAALGADPELRRTFAEMDPMVRRMLTLCESTCIPTKPRPKASDVQAISDLIARLGLPGDHQGLREFLHFRKQSLSKAVKRLRGIKSQAELRELLDIGIQERAESLGVTAEKNADGRWVFTHDETGTTRTEGQIGIHSDQAHGDVFKLIQSHHAIQDDWALTVLPAEAGYRSIDAWTVMLRDSRAGTPHRRVTDRQIARKGDTAKSTYLEQRELMKGDMEAAGVDPATRDRLLAECDSYFAKIASNWLSAMTKRGVPKDRRGLRLREVFGNWERLP